MSTVPGPDTPAPADNNKTLTIGDGSAMYARPTAGGAATGDNQGAGPGVIPDNRVMGGVINAPPDGDLASAYANPNYEIANIGAPTSAAGTQAGPDMGHGATQILTGISGGGDTDNDGDTM